MYFLGVDGGATKTQVIISDESGNVLGLYTGGASYIRTQSKESLLQNLEETILGVLEDAKLKDVRVAKSCFGIAGLDLPKDFELVRSVLGRLKSIRLDVNPIVLNDVVCALRRGTDKGFGIAVVGGTGSNCYAKSKFGSETFVSGLGEILSDEGSSYFVGSKVLHAATKSYDGRIEKSLLEEMVCEHFKVSTVRDVVAIVHSLDFKKKDIAALSVICDDAAEKGDTVAHKILVEAGEELALMVETAARKINMTGDSFDIVCVGGSFKRPHGPIRRTFEHKLSLKLRKARLVYPVNEPATGALLIAIDKFKRGHGSKN